MTPTGSTLMAAVCCLAAAPALLLVRGADASAAAASAAVLQRPCIRFAHFLPTEHLIDFRLEQTAPNGSTVDHKWTGFKFGQISEWVRFCRWAGAAPVLISTLVVSTFYAGSGATGGKAYIYESGSDQPLIEGGTPVPLDPGPLVVALKVPNAYPGTCGLHDVRCYWPPRLDPGNLDWVEPIAASYNNALRPAALRIFNLSPDPRMTFATMKFGDKSLSVDVKYGTGHQPGNFDWFPVPNNTMLNLTFVDGFTQQTLVSKTEPPPGWPTFSGTNYLIGMNQSNFTFKIVYTNDAPEGGIIGGQCVA